MEKRSLFKKVFGKDNKDKLMRITQSFKTFDAYRPVFRNFSGALYESDLVRASIDSIARHISKLSVDFIGTAESKVKTNLKSNPNPFQTWSQWLYRTATILEYQNSAFIVPMRNEFGDTYGIYTLIPNEVEVVKDKKDNVYLQYRFRNGKLGICEIEKCGILTKHQYRSDFFGESNMCLTPVMDLITIQQQGIKEGVKNSATYRFMAQINNFADDEDIKKRKEEFNKDNFQSDNNGGILLFPHEFDNIKQLSNTQFSLDANQMDLIQKNVYNYFGTNEKILQNIANEVEMDAFFNGKIEPFSIQLSEILTRMLFSGKEYVRNRVFVSSNRLQYMSVANKIQMATQLGDRGLATINEIRELFNYPPIDNGDKMTIRGEYYLLGQDGSITSKNQQQESIKEEESEVNANE